MSTYLTTFSLRDHLDHSWTHERVGFAIDPAWSTARLVVEDEAGTVLPVQVGVDPRDVAATPRAWFVVDQLAALGSRQFRLRHATASDPAAPAGPTLSRVGSTAVLATGALALRLPAAWTPADGPLPSPILTLRGGDDAAWFGAGGIALSPHLEPVSVALEELEAGPLWRSVAIVYTCANGADYRCRITVDTGADHATIHETSHLGRDSAWTLDLATTAPAAGSSQTAVRQQTPPASAPFRPDTMRTHRDQSLSLAAWAAERDSTDMGAIQMPVFSGVWVKDDFYHVAFLDAAGSDRRAVALLGIHGADWDYPYVNQIDLCHDLADGRTWTQFSLKAGTRVWALQLTDRDAILGAKPAGSGPVWDRLRRYETPLHTVLGWTLDWDETPNEARPFAVADRAQLAHARRNATDYAKLRDYVAMLDPDLPGDYTYYHSGTHRTFSPDRKNDPAVLYCVAETDAERRKQAAFLKDVVLTGLAHRRNAMLNGSHVNQECASINLGRGLRPWSALYDFAAAEGVFTEAEQRLARATFAMFCYKIAAPDFWPADALTLRDDHPKSTHRTYWYPGRQHDWAFYNIDNLPHNFHGDLWSAMGCVAMVFPRHPQSAAWVQRTLEWWEHELTEWIFPEGAWLESSTYTLNSMKDYLIYCRMLSNSRIRDYAADERLKRAFRCIAEQLGPQDARIGGNSLPVMGDGGYPNNFCYVLGWMAGLTRDVAPAYSRAMSAAWKGTGEYLTEPGRFGLNLFDFLFLDPSIPAEPLPPTGSKWYHGLGAILRHAERTPEEIYLFIKGGIIYSHFHEPEGTFQLWWNSSPLCDEYGVQYGKGPDGTPLGHPSCHNCIEIPGDNACYNKGDLTVFVTTDAFDYVVVEAPITNAYLGKAAAGMGIWGFKGEMAPLGWHRRHFFFVKPHYLYVYDELECPLPSVYHLNVKATDYTAAGNTVHFTGRLGTDLEFCMLDLADRTMTHDEMDTHSAASSAFVPPPGFYHQHRLHVASPPQTDYASVLVPHRPDTPASAATDRDTGGAHIRQADFTERAMVFPRPRRVALPDLVFHGQVGAVRHHDDGSLSLLQASGWQIGVPGRLVIDGDGPYTAALAPAGDALTITADGLTGRWLRLTSPALSTAGTTATLDGATHPLELLPDGALRLYLPPGKHTVAMRPSR